VETIASSQEILGWLLAVQLDCKRMAETGKSKGSCRLLALPSQNRNTLCGPLYTPAMPGSPPSDALSVKKCLVVNVTPLAQRDLPQLQRPDTVDPALSSRNMPIRGHHLHFAVHHDRPISVSSLDCRRRREKLSRGGRSDDRSKERGCMTSDCHICPSASFRQTWQSLV